MTDYQPLPNPPAHAGRPIEHYAAALFAFVVETRCTATLVDSQLALAEYAGIRASAQVGRDDSAMADALADVRRLILAALVSRQKPEPAAPQPAQEPTEENAGPMARLIPRPSTQPPGSQHAAVDIRF